jgi:hypothetical protein
MTESPKLPSRIQSRRAALKAKRQEMALKSSANTEAGTRIPARYAGLMMGGVAAILFYYDVFNPNHKDLLTLLLASLVLMISCLPMMLFLMRGKTDQVPALEAHGLFYALSFGLAGFLPIPQMMGGTVVNEADMLRALGITFMGMVALLLGYYLAGPQLLKGIKPLHAGQGISPGKLEWLGWLGCAAGLTINWVSRHLAITMFGQISLQFYTLGFFLLLILALEKRATLVTRVAVIGLLLPLQLLLNSGLKTGQLAGIVTLVCWISLVLFRTWRRIPMLLLAGAFIFFLIFQPVKFYVRSLAWGEGINLGPIEMFQVYAEGFRETYGSSSAMMANRKENFDTSFGRINHLATTATIIRDTPASQPYLWGESYLPLLTKWIPRVIWHGKPEEHLGNSWASRYGYLGGDDSTTAYNLPWLPEMYMNFGLAGVVGIMFLLGLFYRLLWVWLMGAAEKPAEYAVAIVFAQSLVFAESNFSLMVGGTLIFAILLWMTLKILHLFGAYSVPIIRGKRSQSKSRSLNKPINESPA